MKIEHVEKKARSKRGACACSTGPRMHLARVTLDAVFWLLFSLSSFEATDAAFGHNKVTEKFDTGVSAHFLLSAKVSYAKRKAKKLNKPLMVLLTKPGCGACQNLKQSVGGLAGTALRIFNKQVLMVFLTG